MDDLPSPPRDWDAIRSAYEKGPISLADREKLAKVAASLVKLIEAIATLENELDRAAEAARHGNNQQHREDDDTLRQALADRIEKVQLTLGQFSAMVSFAYNVRIGAFARSSVLRAINAREFYAVPRRLALWVKAGRWRLPGLVKRRAAEAVMFMAAGPDDAPADTLPVDPPRPVQGKPMRESTTGWAAILSALAGLFSAIGAVFRDIVGQVGGTTAVVVAIVIILQATGWILRERYLKSCWDGI